MNKPWIRFVAVGLVLSLVADPSCAALAAVLGPAAGRPLLPAAVFTRQAINPRPLMVHPDPYPNPLIAACDLRKEIRMILIGATSADFLSSYIDIGVMDRESLLSQVQNKSLSFDQRLYYLGGLFRLFEGAVTQALLAIARDPEDDLALRRLALKLLDTRPDLNAPIFDVLRDLFRFDEVTSLRAGAALVLMHQSDDERDIRHFFASLRDPVKTIRLMAARGLHFHPVEKILNQLKPEQLLGPEIEIHFPDRSSKPKVAVAVLDSFKGLQSFHGWEVMDHIQEQLYGLAIPSIPIHPVDYYSTEDEFEALSEQSSTEDLEALKTLVAAHPDTLFIVNLSMIWPDAHYVEGLMRPDVVQELGNQGVIFVVSAGNLDNVPGSREGLRIGYPRAKNVIVTAAADKVTGLKTDYSWYGPDVDFAVDPGPDRDGTTHANPIVAAVLAKLLSEQPLRTPEEALRLLEKSARPLSDPLFEKGWLGAGLIDPADFKIKIPISPDLLLGPWLMKLRASTRWVRKLFWPLVVLTAGGEAALFRVYFLGYLGHVWTWSDVGLHPAVFVLVGGGVGVLFYSLLHVFLHWYAGEGNRAAGKQLGPRLLSGAGYLLAYLSFGPWLGVLAQIMGDVVILKRLKSGTKLKKVESQPPLSTEPPHGDLIADFKLDAPFLETAALLSAEPRQLWASVGDHVFLVPQDVALIATIYKHRPHPYPKDHDYIDHGFATVVDYSIPLPDILTQVVESTGDIDLRAYLWLHNNWNSLIRDAPLLFQTSNVLINRSRAAAESPDRLRFLLAMIAFRNELRHLPPPERERLKEAYAEAQVLNASRIHWLMQQYPHLDIDNPDAWTIYFTHRIFVGPLLLQERPRAMHPAGRLRYMQGPSLLNLDAGLLEKFPALKGVYDRSVNQANEIVGRVQEELAKPEPPRVKPMSVIPGQRPDLLAEPWLQDLRASKRWYRHLFWPLVIGLVAAEVAVFQVYGLHHQGIASWTNAWQDPLGALLVGVSFSGIIFSALHLGLFRFHKEARKTVVWSEFVGRVLFGTLYAAAYLTGGFWAAFTVHLLKDALVLYEPTDTHYATVQPWHDIEVINFNDPLLYRLKFFRSWVHLFSPWAFEQPAKSILHDFDVAAYTLLWFALGGLLFIGGGQVVDPTASVIVRIVGALFFFAAILSLRDVSLANKATSLSNAFRRNPKNLYPNLAILDWAASFERRTGWSIIWTTWPGLLIQPFPLANKILVGVGFAAVEDIHDRYNPSQLNFFGRLLNRAYERSSQPHQRSLASAA